MAEKKLEWETVSCCSFGDNAEVITEKATIKNGYLFRCIVKVMNAERKDRVNQVSVALCAMPLFEKT